MKALWTQSAANDQGQLWQLDGTLMEPKPVQQPHPLIWFGGSHPAALRRAVRHGNGWMGAGSSSTSQFTEAVGHLKQFLEESRRDPSSFPISKRVYLAVDNDERRAERRLREWFAVRYKNAERGSQVSVWGSVSSCVEQLAEILAPGTQHLMLNPVFDDLEHLEVIAKDISPQLVGI